MRIGTAIFTLLAVGLFIGLPVWGYQVYLKNMRTQSAAVNQGTEALGNAARADLDKLKQQRKPDSTSTTGFSAGTLKNANKAIDKIKQKQ
jgi:hypothetical protein